MRGKDNRALTFVGLAGFLLAVTGLAGAAIHALSREVSPRARKLAAADRIINYVVTKARGPRFQLAGAERVLKLVTHAIMPVVPEYDPERVVAYGVRVRVVAADKDVWSVDLYAEARQSKADLVDGTWMQENAFTLDGDAEIADDREMVVFLPDDLPPGAFLDLRLIGDIDQVLLRVYQRNERTPFRRQMIAKALDVGESSEDERTSTYLPWQFVPYNEQLNRLRHVYERMSALGSTGIDYDTATVYFTGFRLPVGLLDDHGSMVLNKDRAVAVNLLGPGAVTLRFAPPNRAVAESHAHNLVTVERLGPGAVEPPREIRLSVDATTDVPFGVPQDVNTMVVRNRGPTPVRLTVLEGSALGFGLPPPPRLDDRGGPAPRRHLLPDQRGMQTHLIDQGTQPVVVKIDPQGDLLARVLRVDVRFPFAGDFTTNLPSATLAVEFLDEAGRSLGRHTRRLEAAASEFERLEKVAIMATDSKSSFRPILVPMGITDPVNFRVINPPGTTTLRVSSDAPAVVNLFSYIPAEDLHELPYRDVELVGLRWRYAPLERRRWLPIAPDNRAEIMVAGNAANLVAQVRLIPDDAKPIRGPRPTTSLEPRGTPERQEVLEPFYGSRRQALATWGPGLLAGMRLDQAMRVLIDAKVASRASLHYRCSPADLGARLQIIVDDKPLGTIAIDRTRGFFRLPRLPAGERVVKVTGVWPPATEPSRSFQVFVDRPPLEAADLYHVRTVYALDSSELRLHVDRRADEDVVINAIIYDRGRAADPSRRVHAVIDGGEPPRSQAPTTHLTIADKIVSMPPANRPRATLFLDRQGQAGFPRVVPIFIGQDLATRHHKVGLTGLGGERFWARFFVSKHRASLEERALQWGLTDDLAFERAEDDARLDGDEGAP